MDISKYKKKTNTWKQTDIKSSLERSKVNRKIKERQKILYIGIRM